VRDIVPHARELARQMMTAYFEDSIVAAVADKQNLCRLQIPHRSYCTGVVLRETISTRHGRINFTRLTGRYTGSILVHAILQVRLENT
jgi:hypothetical protein